MNEPVIKAELFEGALVRCKDIDSFFAIVLAIEPDHIVVADVYGFFENKVLINQLSAIKINPYLLARMGFRRASDINDKTYYYHDDTNCKIQITEKYNSWELTHYLDSIYPSSMHQLQRLIQALTSTFLTARRDESDLEGRPDDIDN